MPAMRNFLRWTTAHPLVVGLVVVTAVAGGARALWRMPLELFPWLDVPVVNVITHYPGAGSRDIELLISRPIEGRMLGIQGATRVYSASTQGISQVTVQFAAGTRLADARQLVQAQLGALAGSLPFGVQPAVESIGTTLQEVAGYVVYGGGDPVALRSTVRLDFASRLMGAGGVQRVTVLGGEERAFVVSAEPSALARLHLTVRDLADALRRSNLAASEGYLERGGREYVISADARPRTLDEVRALPVTGGGARPVLLGQVAQVSEGYAPRHYTVHGDGVPAVAFLVTKQPGASTLAVVRAVDALMPQLQRLLPAGARIVKVYDQSEIIAEARQALVVDLLLGMALAVAVLYLFLGSLRSTLIVAATIPLTLLAVALLMDAFGLQLNVVTLSALALAVGMIVDDAIVVAENVFRHLQRGSPAREASVEGAAQIAGADASGTFTTVAAFVPLVLVTGIAGLFLKPFGAAISAALLVSLALSLTFVPVAFSKWGRPAAPGAAPGTGLLQRLDRAVQRVLKATFRHPVLTIILAVLSLGIGGLAALLGPPRLLPAVDEGALLVEYVMPPGTSLAESDRVADALEHTALAQPEVSAVYRRTGSAEEGFQVEGVNRGEMLIKLKPRAERSLSADQVLDRLRATYRETDGVVFLYHQPTQEKMDESLSGLPALFGVTVFGPDMDELARLAGQVQQAMARDPAVSSIVNNAATTAPQIDVRPDYAALARHGASAQDVFDTVRAARLGLEATRVLLDRQEVHLMVRVLEPAGLTVKTLGALRVNTAGGGAVPLDRLADVQVVHVPAEITRLNGQREVTLLADVSGSIPAAVSRLRTQFASIRLPAGYSIEFTGQYRLLMQTLVDMAFVVGAAVILIYFIIRMQLGSWVEPLIILVTVPFSLIGAVVALVLAHQALNVSVGMGVLTLTGIAVNNAIVLLDYANQTAREGVSRAEALLSAASVRLRPILMTALTTIIALVPVAFSPAVGSKLFQPFAFTVIGGLASATLASLVLVPTLASLAAGAASHPKRPAGTAGADHA
jgi:CzcA family heavy metal efflux pump